MTVLRSSSLLDSATSSFRFPLARMSLFRRSVDNQGYLCSSHVEIWLGMASTAPDLSGRRTV